MVNSWCAVGGLVANDEGEWARPSRLIERLTAENISLGMYGLHCDLLVGLFDQGSVSICSHMMRNVFGVDGSRRAQGLAFLLVTRLKVRRRSQNLKIDF